MTLPWLFAMCAALTLGFLAGVVVAWITRFPGERLGGWGLWLGCQGALLVGWLVDNAWVEVMFWWVRG